MNQCDQCKVHELPCYTCKDSNVSQDDLPGRDPLPSRQGVNQSKENRSVKEVRRVLNILLSTESLDTTGEVLRPEPGSSSEQLVEGRRTRELGMVDKGEDEELPRRLSH